MSNATLTIYNASAGSGKTTTLVREILKIILSGNDIAIREVLGMTFTNAVANELKKRMVEVLYDVTFNSNKFDELKNKYFKDISLSEEEVVQKCKTALIYILHHYTDLSLQTIDSFFNRILKGFAKELNYSYNIANNLSEKFYKIFGAELIEPAFELQKNFVGKLLMTTKYCIRYEIDQCPKYNLQSNNQNLFLVNNGNLFKLVFDCKNCLMKIYYEKAKDSSNRCK